MDQRWLVVLAVLAGCEPVPQTLPEVKFPSGFVLDTHTRVTVEVEPGTADLDRVHVQLGLTDGQPLFVGSLGVALLRTPQLKVPVGTDRLVASVRFPDGTEEAWDLPVVDGRTRLVVGGAR